MNVLLTALHPFNPQRITTLRRLRQRMLEDMGIDSEPPHISPARGPPLWDDCEAHVNEAVAAGLDWDGGAQPAHDFKVDKRINW